MSSVVAEYKENESSLHWLTMNAHCRRYRRQCWSRSPSLPSSSPLSASCDTRNESSMKMCHKPCRPGTRTSLPSPSSNVRIVSGTLKHHNKSHRIVQLLLPLSLSLLLLINGVSSRKTSPIQQKFEMEPIDKTAIVGDTVILPCRVENKVGTLQWTRDEFGLGTERSLEGFQRYRMVGSDDEGDYSLEISPVTLEDDATFQCQVGAVQGVNGLRSKSAAFTVQVPPDPPVIVVTHAHSHAQIYKSSDNQTLVPGNPAQNEMLVSTSGMSGGNSDHHLRTSAGMTIELTCEAHGGRPPAELTWMDSKGNAISSGVQYTTTMLADGKRWNSALKWTVVAGRSLDGERVMCRSENAASKSPRYAFIQLEVRYAPEVELRISSSNSDGDSTVREGDDLTLECVAAGNPSRMTFKWTRDGVPVTSGAEGVASGDGTPRLVFRRIGREFHQTVIACEVTNAVGTSRAKLEVNVAYKPRFVKPPEPIVGIEKGESTKLHCKVDSHPRAGVVWSKLVQKVLANDEITPNHPAGRVVEHWQEVSDGATIDVSSAGRYRCNAKNSAFDDELKGETFVFIKGAPTIRSAAVQFGNENESVRLQCIVEAIPPPTKITWFKLKPHQQILGVDNNEGYEISEEEDPDDFSMVGTSMGHSAATYTNVGVNTEQNAESVPFLSLLRSIISIRRARDTDFDQYNCSVWNQYGFSSQIITLQKQETYLSPLLLTLGGIFGTGLVFVVSATILVFACLRGQRFKDHGGLGPKKLESTDRMNGAVLNTNHEDLEKKMNTMNSITEKNMNLMKNTVMQIHHTGSGQVRTTLLNDGSAVTNGGFMPNGETALYSDYDFHYAPYGTANDILVPGQATYGYDNISAYSANYDYAHSNAIPTYAPEKNQIGIPSFQPDPSHLYSTVVKPSSANISKNLTTATTSGVGNAAAANYHHQSLLVSAPIKVDNDSNNISCSFSSPNRQVTVTTTGLGQPQYGRQYSQGLHDPHDSRMLNASSIYGTARFNSTNPNGVNKTNSLGGGSSSSGVISNGASSPGHSPVGSGAISNGTHV